MKKWIALLICLLLPFGAFALEISEDEFYEWYDEMAYLVDEIGNRWIELPGSQQACDYLRAEFEANGFSKEDGTLIELPSYVPELDLTCTNLIAVKPAVNPDAPIITVCAHYDSQSPGARDNASGVAAMMFIMRKMAALPAFENTELRFVAFTAEEYFCTARNEPHIGSLDYCYALTEEEKARHIAVFNIDILVVDIWEELAFSLDTLGMRTDNGYVTGAEESPAYNRPALAMLQAMAETECYPEEDRDWYWCGPRHMDKTDHESFHYIGVDSVAICFRQTDELGGEWPEFMHTPSDILGDFDLQRSWDALTAVYTAVDGLANDHTYGDAMKP